MMYERRVINAVIDRDLDSFLHPRFLSLLLLRYPIPVIVVILDFGNPPYPLEDLGQVLHPLSFPDQLLHLRSGVSQDLIGDLGILALDKVKNIACSGFIVLGP